MRLGDFWSGSLVAAIGTGAVCFAWPLEFWSEFGPGPGFFPILLGAGLIAMGAVVGIAALVRDVPGLPPANLRKPLLVAGVMAVYLALLTPLGFPVATAAFLFTLIHWVESRGVWQALGVAVVTTLALHVIFTILLKTPLPVGILAWTS